MADCGCATCCPAGAALRPAADRHPGAQQAAGDGGAGLNLALSPVTPEILAARAAARHAATHRGHRAVPPPRHQTAAAAPAHQPRASGVVQCAADPAGAAAGIPGAARRARAGQPTFRRSKPSACAPRRGARRYRVEYRQPAGRSGTRRIGDHARAGRRAVPGLAGSLCARHRPRRYGRGRPWSAHMTWPAATSGCEG